MMRAIGYSIFAVAVFAACWVPCLLGLVSNEWVSASLGAISGVPIVIAMPFVMARLRDGVWVWEL